MIANDPQRKEEKKRIVIVGAGPTGLTLAILLRLKGLEPIVVEHNDGLEKLPQAHVVNARTMEIFDEIGVAEACEQATTFSALGPIRWCESVAGRQLGELSFEAIINGRSDLSHRRVLNLAQNIVEPILYERLIALGGEVRFGHSVTDVRQDQDCVTVVATDRAGNVEELRCDWLIGCDGASSSVRRAVGIEMEGPPSLARFMTVYFKADLSGLVNGDLGALFWIVGKSARGSIISFDGNSTYAYLVPIGDLPISDFSEEMALNVLRKAIGDNDLPLELIGLSNWNMSAQVAERYREGAVLLAGDACHRFPPTGGLGMNTGIQDAHNLAWKLAAVISGHAPATLLDSYETERRPIARRNTDQSVGNLMKLRSIDEALGVPTLAPITLADCEGTFEPYPAEVLGIDGTGPDAAERRARIQSAIDEQRGHFGDSIGVDLGFSYSEGALLPDGSPPPSQNGHHYDPDAHPGARLPHFTWRCPAGITHPSLDLIERDRPTLVTGSADWRALDGERVAVRVIEDFEANQPAMAALRIAPDGAVIVRPDGHVAWRSATRPEDLNVAVSEAYRCIYAITEGER